MTEELDLFKLSLKDFFSAKMLKFSVVPFIATLFIMYLFFFALAGAGLDTLGTMDFQSTETTIQNGIPHTETIQTQLEGSSIIKFLMSYTLTSWLASFLVYAVGGLAVLYLSIVLALVVIGFLTPYILREVQRRHYQDVEMLGYANFFTSLLRVFKYFTIMILLFFFLIPLYFVPLLNVVAFNLPLYYFFHKMITFDVASNIVTQEEKRLIAYKMGNSLRLKTLALYLISLIPFAIFFGAVFYVIYLGHNYFTQVQELIPIPARNRNFK